MNFKTINEKDSLLLHRKEYILEIEFPKEKTPSNEIVKKEASSFLKSTPDLTVIKKIDQYYGNKKAKVYVYVYQDEKVLKKIEIINKVKKKTKGGESAPAEAPKK